MPTFSMQRPIKIYPHCNCWYANVPRGNPTSEIDQRIKNLKKYDIFVLYQKRLDWTVWKLLIKTSTAAGKNSLQIICWQNEHTMKNEIFELYTSRKPLKPKKFWCHKNNCCINTKFSPSLWRKNTQYNALLCFYM
jgi:hypothetical protein